MEAWLTFILVQTVWGATNGRRKKLFMPSIPIGLAVTMDIMAGVGPFKFLLAMQIVQLFKRKLGKMGM